MTHPDVSTCDVFASVSGGKDSTAMCLHLKEQGIPYRAVFADTGWEHSVTYDYLRGLDPVIGPIQWVRAEVPLEGKRLAMAEELEAMLGHYSAMVRAVLKKGIMPSGALQWCTTETKIGALDAFMQATGDSEIVCAIGVRAQESRERAMLEEWEFAEDRDLWVWRPLLRLSEQEVRDIHAHHGIRPNPLYLKISARRVGCWPCINSRKSEILATATTDPTRIDVLRKLEAFLLELINDRAAAKDEAAEAAKIGPTWFRRKGKQPDGAPVAVPIDDVVAWSKTGRGGNVKQTELFMPRTEPGCIRWGMCDFAGDDDE